MYKNNDFKMNIPTKSYRIWTSPRTGHTVLAKLLSDTGIAGKPGEHLTLHGESSLGEKYGVKNYDEIRNKIWESGTCDTGIFGCKMDRQDYSVDKDTNELMKLKGFSSSENEELFWADLFPNCKNIYLTRRNKVRQVVSWWKAIQDNTWHLKTGETRNDSQEFYNEKYDFDALSHLLLEASLREASMQEYFSKYNLATLTLVYEDYIQNLEESVLRVLDYLGIKHDNITIPEVYYSKTSDSQSEEWVQRFRKDLQKGWDTPSW